MSKCHVMRKAGNSLYQIVIHATTPASNNAAGISLATAVVNAGLAATVMPEGTGAGQITSSEKLDILAGNVLEGQFLYQDDLSLTVAQRLAALDAAVASAANELVTRLSDDLRYFGLTRT